MAEQSYDLVVVGGGPGGYVAAIRGAQLGMKTAVVEKEHLGGVCLNWGCIPTKALLRSAEVFRNMKHADQFGLSAGTVGFDLQKIVKRSRNVSAKLQGGVGHLLKKNKVTVIEGTAKLQGPGRLTVEQNAEQLKVTGKHIILATGARPLQIKGLEADGKLVWTYKEAMVPKSFPKSLLVVGAGAIGLEFASFYNELGCEVTIVEALPQLLPTADHEVSALGRAIDQRVENPLLGFVGVVGPVVPADGQRRDRLPGHVQSRVVTAVGNPVLGSLVVAVRPQATAPEQNVRLQSADHLDDPEAE